jgi:hypothetical protein
MCVGRRIVDYVFFPFGSHEKVDMNVRMECDTEVAMLIRIDYIGVPSSVKV